MAYPAPGGWRVAGMIIKNDLPSGLNCGLRAFCWRESGPHPHKHLATSNERREAARCAFATCPGSQVDKQRVLLVDHINDHWRRAACVCKGVVRSRGQICAWAARAILNPQRVSR